MLAAINDEMVSSLNQAVNKSSWEMQRTSTILSTKQHAAGKGGLSTVSKADSHGSKHGKIIKQTPLLGSPKESDSLSA